MGKDAVPYSPLPIPPPDSPLPIPRFDTRLARLYHLAFIDPIRYQNEEK